MDESCGNCRFHFRPPNVIEPAHHQFCRRFPPFEFDKTWNRPKWPTVSSDSWCGEWQLMQQQTRVV